MTKMLLGQETGKEKLVVAISSRALFDLGESHSVFENQGLATYGANLLLSTNAADVRSALAAGHAAATILPGSSSGRDSGQLRIAFDGDAVVFSDEAERVYQQQGLAAFALSESEAAN